MYKMPRNKKSYLHENLWFNACLMQTEFINENIAYSNHLSSTDNSFPKQ